MTLSHAHAHEKRGALIRVSPEAMTELLGLPEGNKMLRFELVGGVLQCLAMGPTFPVLAATGPTLMDVSDLDLPR